MFTYPRILSCIVLSAVLASCSPETPINGTAELPLPESPVSVSLEDYQRAESFLAANTAELVVNDILSQYWQDNDRLIYRKSTTLGEEYQIVDLVTNSRTSLVDPILLANELAEFSDEELDPNDLSLSDLKVAETLDSLEFTFEDNQYQVDLADLSVNQLEAAPEDEVLSPDGSKAAFTEDHNLWVRDTSSNELTQLTFDGVEDYGYATNNAGWLRSDVPVVLWSPDSSKIATFRHDSRQVREMHLYNTQVGHLELDSWKYPLPGDEHIFMIERVVVHLDPEPGLVPLAMPQDAHRSTTSDHIAGRNGRFLDVEWSADSEQLAFVSSSRDHRIATLRLADPETGAVREIYTEEADTYYESGANAANWRVFRDRGEFLWFSERDDWGHLYLFDLDSGELKRQLTSGPWSVLRVQHVDLETGTIFFVGSNREPGDPYFQYLYRIELDGSGLTNLTPEIANHVISWSDSNDYFTDSYSSPTEPEVTVIRNTQGEIVQELERMDISALVDSGWVAPEPFVVKARDQQTNLHGLLYKPSNFDTNRSYPVLNYLYPGPQSGSVGSRSFRASRNDKQALAELGFIVVEVDAMGTPGRSKPFHDAYYGNMGDNGLPDQIASIRQLAADRPWMDLDRVGIWGHSGGGFASTAGILRYPDFYKVAVSGAGNHDNRNYEDDWAEKWQGLLETYPESTPGEDGEEAEAQTNYDNQANQLLAENLQGKLLLAHGMMDSNVHPSNTLLVVDALIEADKDFDLVILPNAGHGFGNRRYFMKRRWDYFVEHLLGAEPPEGFQFADNIR